MQKALHKRHGCQDEIKICLNSFTEENEIADEMLTLRECGLNGKVPKNAIIGQNGNITYDDTDLPVYQIYYDMKPTQLLDPLLLY